jgi:hypothetical protein
LREGRGFPLGATWTGLGVNFALFSAHATKVELCLFDEQGEREIERIELPEFTDEVWHGFLPDARPGTIYGVEFGESLRTRGQSQWGRSVMSALRSGGIAAALVGSFLLGSAEGVQAQNATAWERPAAERGPKSLFEWTGGSRPEDKHAEKSKEEDRIDPDRPHFPEASTTAGNGRIVLESGYTFAKKDGTFLSHSYPESLLRVGVFVDWFEFRIGQNFAYQRQTTEDMTTTASGAQDLYLGMKLGLTDQKGFLPRTGAAACTC